MLPLPYLVEVMRRRNAVICGRFIPRGASSATGITRNSYQTTGTKTKRYASDNPREGFSMTSAGLIEKNVKAAMGMAAEGQDLEEILRRATIDFVTGIYNAFEIERRAARSLEQSRHLALVVVDLDGLKGINDSLGHLEGNRYLSSFVKFCKKNLRSADQVGRTGGDEFLIVMPETTAVQAEKIMSRLQKITDQLNIKFSYGVSDATAEPNTNLLSLIELADSLMYQQKRKRKLKQ